MRVLMLAGEASGDAHAAKVARILLKRGARIDAVGGPALQATGARLLHRIEEFAVVGIVEVLRKLPRILKLKSDIQQRLQQDHYDLFLPVDYPGLNLRLAATAKRCEIPVLHYIGPQVWAWRAGRLRSMKKNINHVALILPFEKAIYDEIGLPASFVGHPLLEDRSEPRTSKPLYDLALFPGSRRQEIQRHLPMLLETIRQLSQDRPNLSFVISRAPTVPRELFARILKRSGFSTQVLCEDVAAQVMRESRALLVASGTATLEAALSKTPFAVFYRTARLNYELIRPFIKVSHVSMVNLIAQQEIVHEYLQTECTASSLHLEALALLDNETERQRIITGLTEVCRQLGSPGASTRVADLAARVVGEFSRTMKP